MGEVAPQCTVQRFLDVYVENVIFRLKKIQSTVIRWNSIKIESKSTSTSSSFVYPLNGVYGEIDTICDTLKGFQIDLVPSKGSATKRFYVRGVPDVLNFFDHKSNPELFLSVQSIERMFIDNLGSASFVIDQEIEIQEGYTFRCVVPSTTDLQGYETIGSSNAIKLHLFKKREISVKHKKRVIKK